MKRKCSIKCSRTLLDKFQDLPISRSAAICQAIHNAGNEPELLAQALRLRLNSRPAEAKENDTLITYTRDAKLDRALQTLTGISELPGEQVIRLAMEAYIYKL